VEIFDGLLDMHEVIVNVSFLYESILVQDTSFPSSGAKRLAIILEINLAKEWMRLIGLKSEILSALGFFTIKTTRAWFKN
jgi:hypothetical protein